MSFINIECIWTVKRKHAVVQQLVNVVYKDCRQSVDFHPDFAFQENQTLTQGNILKIWI